MSHMAFWIKNNLVLLTYWALSYWAQQYFKLIFLWIFWIPYSCKRSFCYSKRLHDFIVTIPGCYKDVNINSFFPRTISTSNSLTAECFPFTCNLNAFMSRVNRYPLFLFFLVSFPISTNLSWPTSITGY